MYGTDAWTRYFRAAAPWRNYWSVLAGRPLKSLEPRLEAIPPARPGGVPVLRSPDWLKMKNPEAPAVKREAEEEWGRR